MSEWYGQVHELMLKESVTKDNIAGAVSGCKTIRLRDGMLDLLQACQTHDPVIPVIIMSAGLGDVIEEFLRQVPFELGASTHIVSNRMAFDAAGRLVEFSEPLLHMFNKTAAFFPEATKELVKGRRFCMLFGDGVGDSTMADGLEVETLKASQTFQQKFDVVVTGDGPVPELAFAAIGAKSVWKLLGWDPATPEHLHEEHAGAIYTSLLASSFAKYKMALPLLRLLAAGAAVWAASATRSVGSSLSLHPTPAICRVRCRTEQSCTDWPATCLDCPVCEDFRKQPDVAPEECPSYCINAKWCILMSSVCTPQRCPHICADETGAAPVVPAEMRPLNELMLELEGLVGLGQVKSQMKELIAQVDFNLQRSKLSLPDIGGQSLHMAFLGNPGTGKTVVARIVGELLVTMGAIKRPTDGTSGPASIVKEVSRADLVGEHVGSTALKVSKAFEEAMGGVLFIDEAYSIVQGDRDSFGKEAVDTIIKLMEDHRDQIIVILAGYQKEMADFIAANPGFKSRVAFNFNFPDYTCPELVDIAERLMKSKNVGLSATRADVCQGPDTPSACEWLKSAIRFRTGCCEAADCGKKENRANGNGRTVRNVLEASYREMASRVLTTFTPGLLQDYDSAKRPAVRGRGKEATPEPALHCGRRFERLRAGGPYSSMQDVGDADVRCAFRLLDESDLRSSTAASLGEQLQANCQTTKTPVTVNVSSTLETLSPASLDWDRLHQGLYHERECSRVQALLSSGSLLQLSAVPSSHSDSEDERCKYCTNEGMCTMRRSICEGCASCQRFTQDTEAEGLATSEAQCKVCGWVKRKYRNTPAMELPLLMDSRNICSIYNRAHPAEGVSSSHCRRAVSRTLTQLSGGVRKFTCSSVLSLECPEDQENAVRDAGGVGAMLRPGSKVDDLMKELQELIGLQSVKSGISALRDSVEFDMWRRKFLGEHWSLLGQSFHMRFLGNPGTGKTVVARIVGKILVELGVVKHEDADEGFVFKEVSRADLVGGYVGHTAPK
ncbi:unnamed protein product, partial [Effrenium voratum]